MQELRLMLPGFVALRHEDVRTCGIPDLSLTGLNKTTWWEFKYGHPDFSSHGIQELIMLRLAAAGFARYVLWMEVGNGVETTLIVHPKKLKDLEWEVAIPRFDHKAVVSYMKAVHERMIRS